MLTGVDFTDATTKKIFQKQITDSLRKFAGRSVISTVREDLAVAVKTEATWLSEEVDEVLVAQGWKPPKKSSRRRSRSESPTRSKSSITKERRIH